ncbi:MAG: sugar ABC transporter ATP-binding protein [Lentisphaeraceae bacterium]|nr:sugar ABC transporter ATP-binding protein [Lentisphaeraceae bacterium]
MSFALSVDSLTKEFPGVKALDQLSFSLEEGAVHSLCGENGAGKSTLIKCISGIWPSTSYEGQIDVFGSTANFSGISDSEKAGIAVIYQELALVEDMTVAENIFLGREPKKGFLVDWNQMYDDSKKILKEYNLDLNPSDLVGDLGVGQQQLVEIVKALSKNAKILLLDEPTAALTDSEVKILIKIIADLKKRNISCIYISHRLEEVLEISDYITVIRDGQSISTKPRKEWTYDSVVSAMVGREITNLYPRKKSTVGNPLIKIEELSVTGFSSSHLSLDEISFEVRKGEVLGFGGLMGAGRSELLMNLFHGVGNREKGRVVLKEENYDSPSAKKSISRGLIMVTEDRKRFGLVLDESIAFNLSLSHLKTFVKVGLVDGNKEMTTNSEFAQKLKVKAPDLSVSVGSLSGGNQQKVVLGKALMTEPDIVFLDEPTRGIDVGAKVEVYELINQLTEAGKAVVLVSSEMPELLGMSDRILILSAGKIAGEFDPEESTQEDLLEAAMKFS